jgi:hypothetical protein
MLFPKNDAVIKMTVGPHTHTARSVHSRFEEHEDALQHLPKSPQSPDLNIIEPLRSVLESTVIGRLPPRSSVKQPEDVLDEQRHSVALETVRNLCESVASSTQAVLQTNGGPTL